MQEEYFAHAEKAMDNLRAAKASEPLTASVSPTASASQSSPDRGAKNKRNAAALKTEDAAEKLGTRFEIDNIVVTSAYEKKNIQGLLNRDQILYIDPNKNRTNTWLAVNRLQLPLRITKYGSIASLRYSDGNVKSVNVENARTDEPVKKTTRFQLASPVEVNETKELVAVHNLTEENLREALDLGGMPSPSIAVVNGNHDRANAVLDEVRQAEKTWAMEELGWSEEKAQTKAARLIAPMLRSRLENAYEYVTTKDVACKLVQDTDAMRQELQQKAPDADVESWLLPQMEKILGEKGIYNGKDPYTKQGNRRSFAQLHNPYTLENLVAAMNQEEARGKGAWGIASSGMLPYGKRGNLDH